MTIEPLNLKCKSVQKRLATQWRFVPENHALLPIEPTPEIMKALREAMVIWVQELGTDEDIYRAIIQAAVEQVLVPRDLLQRALNSVAALERTGHGWEDYDKETTDLISAILSPMS